MLSSALIHGAMLVVLLSLGSQVVVNTPRPRKTVLFTIAPLPVEQARPVRGARMPAQTSKLTAPAQPVEARRDPPARLFAPPEPAPPPKPAAMPAPPKILAEVAPMAPQLLGLPAPKPIPEPIKTGLFQPAATAANANPKLTVETGNFLGATPTRAGTTDHQIAATGGFGGIQTADRIGSRTGADESAGFGQAVAAKPGQAPQSAAASAGFAAPTLAEATKPTAPEDRALSVAKILEKPRPAYTEEARNLKIEGEVLVEVLFSANGKARVLRVIHGLGHGLDQSAVRAAEGIRFSPAFRGGAPVDSVAVAHIEFQLAY